MKKLLGLVFFSAVTMISFAWVVVLKFPHRDGGTSNRDGGTSMVSRDVPSSIPWVVSPDGKQVWPARKSERTFPCIQPDGKTKWILSEEFELFEYDQQPTQDKSPGRF
jgi:hypothetical protein